MRKPHAPDTQAAPDRRSFLRGSVMFGTGVLAAGALGSETVLAQQAPAAPAAPAVGAAKPPALTYAQVMNKARELMYPICRVCPECDGQACAGEVPGMGGIGSGASFKNNIAALNRVRLNLRSLHADGKPELGITLFGQKLDVPFLITSLAGTTYNMGGKIGEAEFIEALF